MAVFDAVSTKTGDVAPDRVITGAATLLTDPAAIFLDPIADTLYVANGANSVLILSNASARDGNVAPSRTIAGAATGIGSVAGIVGGGTIGD